MSSSSSATTTTTTTMSSTSHDFLVHSSYPSSHPDSFTLTNNIDGIVSEEEEKPKTEADDVNLECFETGGGDASTRTSDKKKDGDDGEYPSGEFELRELGGWWKFTAKSKMLFARTRVLKMKLRGKITEHFQRSRSSRLSLPRICENFIKAAHDPRISGIYLHIHRLSCGWATAEEIRRHILDFKKSKKFVVGYSIDCREKDYYIGCACDELYVPPSAYVSLYGLTVEASFFGGVLEKVGIDPQVERIGKYKSYGDKLTRKTMSEENREMLTALLDNIYKNWVDKVSQAKGKTKEDIEIFLNEGVYKVEQLKEDGWITDIKYDDEVLTMLKERLKLPKDKDLPTVDYRKYSAVRGSTLGLTGDKDQIAVIRACGSITHSSGSGIVAEDIIKKIRKAKKSKKFKAVIIRINSPGGEALSSDLIWREIKLLSESKPVVASMGDMAASGGYYMAMGTNVIVAENLTFTGSIGVVAGKFNLEKLYEKIGFNKEIISRGKFSELTAANQRPLRPDEAEHFAKLVQNVYDQFRDKAAVSRSMPVEKMEEVAQGRLWTGNDAASRGLVDAIGGFRRAVAIAKQKAKIPQDHEVKLVEMVRPVSLLKKLCAIRNFLTGADKMLNLLDNMSSSDGIDARMDGIMFQLLDGADCPSSISRMLNDHLGSLLN